MKQRTITGAAIVALLILVMFARQLTLYVFDAFIVCLAVLASFEMSNLLARQGMYNNKYFVISNFNLCYIFDRLVNRPRALYGCCFASSFDCVNACSNCIVWFNQFKSNKK